MRIRKKVEPGQKLSPRELQALEALANLETYDLVAHELKISKLTARNLIAHAYRKLDVNGSLGAMKALGWLRVPKKPMENPLNNQDAGGIPVYVDEE